MSHIMRKPFFRVSDHAKMASDLKFQGIVYVAKTKVHAVIAQLICAFVFAYTKSRFSHDEAHYMKGHSGRRFSKTESTFSLFCYFQLNV